MITFKLFLNKVSRIDRELFLYKTFSIILAHLLEFLSITNYYFRVISIYPSPCSREESPLRIRFLDDRKNNFEHPSGRRRIKKSNPKRWKLRHKNPSTSEFFEFPFLLSTIPRSSCNLATSLASCVFPTHRCRKNSLAAEARRWREPAGSVGLSVILIPRGEAPEKTKKLPSPPSLFSSRMALNFGGVSLSFSRWPKNRVAVFPEPYGPATGRRRQLDEHESPGETALLTGYLLGSREGGTYSPLEPNQPPSSAFFCLAPAIRFVVIACFWSHRRRGGRASSP